MNQMNAVIANVTGNLKRDPRTVVGAVLDGLANDAGRLGILTNTVGVVQHGSEFLFDFMPYAGVMDQNMHGASANPLPLAHVQGNPFLGLVYDDSVDIIIGNADAVANREMRGILAEFRSKIIAASTGTDKGKGFHLPLIPAGTKNNTVVYAGKLEGEMRPAMIGKAPATSSALDTDTKMLFLSNTQGGQGNLAMVERADMLFTGAARVIHSFPEHRITNLGMPVGGTMRVILKDKDGHAFLQKLDVKKLGVGGEIKPIGTKQLIPEGYVFAGTAQTGHAVFLNTQDRMLHYVRVNPVNAETIIPVESKR